MQGADKPDAPSDTESKTLGLISKSAVVLLSTQINKYMLRFFGASEVLLAIVCIHTIASTIQHVPGFNTSWRTISGIVQTIAVQTVSSYIAEGSKSVSASLVHLLIVVQFLECLPALRGWEGRDLDSFRASVSYVFSDQISETVKGLGIPLSGAVLGLSLGSEGLLGQTLTFSSIALLNSYLFLAVSGGELGLAWPLMLLYFAVELTSRFGQVQAFVDFGLYRASDAVYQALRARGLSVHLIAAGFVFVMNLHPSDKVWSGICTLVLLQAGSDWALSSVTFISNSDPVLAGLVVVTAVHFCVLFIDYQNAEKKGGK